MVKWTLVFIITAAGTPPPLLSRATCPKLRALKRAQML